MAALAPGRGCGRSPSRAGPWLWSELVSALGAAEPVRGLCVAEPVRALGAAEPIRGLCAAELGLGTRIAWETVRAAELPVACARRSVAWALESQGWTTPAGGSPQGRTAPAGGRPAGLPNTPGFTV